MNENGSLEIRELQPTDESAVVGLLRSTLGEGPAGNRTSQFFRWKHRASPFGMSPGLVAVQDARIVAVRLFLRWQLEAAGRQVLAVRAVDTATDPDFRGRGLFRTLTLDLLHSLEERSEVDLVFNTPNGNSRPGYLKMGWQEVGTLPVRLGITRPLHFVRGLRSAASATATSASTTSVSVRDTERTKPLPLPACPFPSAADVLTAHADAVADLLDAAPPRWGLHTPRSLEYLRWRYSDASGLDYRAITVGTGRPTGVAFGRLRRRGTLAEFTLSDLLVHDGDTTSTRRLLRAARHSGAVHVAVHTSSADEQRAAATAGYVTVPRYGLGLVANPRRRLPVDALDIRSWQLSLGDLEVF